MYACWLFGVELQKPFCLMQHLDQHAELYDIRIIGQTGLWRYAKVDADQFRRVKQGGLSVGQWCQGNGIAVSTYFS